jgi:hypothetical protein
VFTPSEDILLNWAFSTGGNVLLSLDKNLQISQVTGPADNQNLTSILMWVPAGGSAGATIPFAMKIPISQGSPIYVTPSQLCCVFLIYEHDTQVK